MSSRFDPATELPPVLERWGWSSYDLVVVTGWLEVCAVLVIWVS